MDSFSTIAQLLSQNLEVLQQEMLMKVMVAAVVSDFSYRTSAKLFRLTYHWV